MKTQLYLVEENNYFEDDNDYHLSSQATPSEHIDIWHTFFPIDDDDWDDIFSDGVITP
ncbi:MAG: hypothetical protein OEZ43_08650 [Gammaproteobacteria bacterium]|nr:hypothetical protein [Gammaproteobacteria bacterium]